MGADGKLLLKAGRFAGWLTFSLGVILYVLVAFACVMAIPAAIGRGEWSYVSVEASYVVLTPLVAWWSAHIATRRSPNPLVRPGVIGTVLILAFLTLVAVVFALVPGDLRPIPPFRD